MKKLMFILFLILIVCPAVWADTVYLKDGGSLEGTVVGENSVAVTMKIDGKLRKFYRGQIDRLEKDTAKASGGMNASASGEISWEKKELIMRLIESTGVRTQLEESVARAVQSAPPGQIAEFSNLFNVNDILDQIVPIYDKYFTAEDLKEIVAFHESPVALKLKSVMPDLMKDVTQTALEHFQSKMEKNR